MLRTCKGNIIGPQTFKGTNYRPAEITIIVCWCATLVDLAFIYWLCKRRNAKKAQIRAQPGYQKLANHEWLDLTDKENPGKLKCLLVTSSLRCCRIYLYIVASRGDNDTVAFERDIDLYPFLYRSMRPKHLFSCMAQ
jgi:hypothetical protein